MKKITSLIILMLFTLIGYSQVISTGFEAGIPAGWTITNNGNGVNVPWGINTTPGFSNSGNASLMVSFETATVATPIQDWAITPVLNLTGVINPKLSFFGKVSPTGVTKNSRLEIRVSTTDTNLTSFTTTLATFQDYNTNAPNPISPILGTYGSQEISLLPFAGQNIYVAFVMVNEGQGKIWFLDDISIFEDCPEATSLGVSNVGANAVTATWLNPSNAPSFQIEVMPSSEEPNQSIDYTSTTTSVVFTNLQPNTEYKYYIRSVCGTNDFGDWVGPYVFGTTPTPAILPYAENFEGYHGWQFINGTYPNKWFVGSAAQNGGAKSLYISNNDGVSNSYTTNTTTTTHAYRDVVIPATGGNQLQFNFDWKSVGEGSFDYIRVWLVPSTFTPTAGTQLTAANSGGIQIGGNFSLQSSWITYNGIVNVANILGTNRRIVFEWRNDSSGGTQPPGAIDNLNLKIITCSAPTNLVLTSVTQNSAVVTWTAPTTNIPASYDYFLSQTNTTPTETSVPTGNVTTPTVTLNGLQPGQTYYVWVRGNCGTTNGYSTLLGPLVLNTTQIPGTLPYTENFDSPGFVFGFNNGTQVNKWIVGNSTFLSPGNSLYISSDNSTNIYTTNTSSVTHAFRDLAIPLGTNEVKVSFNWKAAGESSFDYIRVWLVPSTFTPTPGTQISVANSGGLQIGGNLNQQSVWNAFIGIQNVASLAGSNARIVFEWRNDSSGGTQPPAAIDDINIEAITCSAPSNLVLTSVTQNSAVVTWTPPLNTVPTSYDYFLTQTNVPPTDTTVPTGNVTTSTVTLNGLLPGQTYYIWVRGNCGNVNGNSILLGPLTFNTTQVPATLPYTENFDTPGFVFGLNNGTQVNKWMVGTSTFLSPGNSLYISSDNSTNIYTVNTSSVTHAFRDLAIPVGANEVNINFNWKAAGESSFDYIRVWLVPSTFTPTPGIQLTTANSGGVQISGNLNQQTTWNAFAGIQNVSAYAGSNARIIFEWRNDSSGGTQPPGAIDDINIQLITCSAPTNLVLTSVTQNSAVVSWTAPLNTVPSSYDYFLTQTNTPPTDTSVPTGNVTVPTVTLNNLQPGQVYYIWVRGNCGTVNGNSTLLGPLVFNTTQIPADLPYNENFDGPGLVFGFVNGNQINKWIVGSSTFNSPDNSLYISDNQSVYNYSNNTSIVHAYRDINIPATGNVLALNFDYKAVGNSSDYMRVWLVPATFNPVAGTQITAASGGFQIGGNLFTYPMYQNLNFEFPAGALLGQTAKLIFEWRNNAVTLNQGPASVDNIILTVLTCPAPTNIQAGVTCEDASVVDLSWTAGGTETSWQYVVLPTNAPAPTNGSVVSQPSAQQSGLTPNTNYNVWVRAICGDNDKSVWVSKTFITAASPVASANPFCAGAEGIVFPNVHDGMGVPNLVTGSFHCLGSTPNPVWYYLQVDTGGNLNFQIVQNTQFNAQGLPVGNTLDVDYIAFGPFDNLNQACSNIITTAGSPNPAFMIVGCSYSAAAVENFNITNAQPGQVYAILITNFNGDPGFIKLVQTNAGQPGAGTTDCDFLCEVNLGEDKIICGNSYDINATISTVGAGAVTSIQWFKDDLPLDPNVYNSLQITVTESGNYSIIIEKENCNAEEPITDSVTITFVNPFGGEIPSEIVLCDIDNNGTEIFDLATFANNLIGNETGYTVTFHSNPADAASGFSPLDTAYESGNATIYVSVSNSAINNCQRIEPIQLIIKETVLPVVVFEYEAPICVNGQANIFPIVANDFTYGGTFSSTQGLVIDSDTGEIDLENSVSGLYDVTYDFPVSPEMCGESDSSTVSIRVLDKIGFLVDGVCNAGKYVITAKDILGTLDFETSTFKWSTDVSSSDGATAVVDKPGLYTLEITTKDGCVETAEIQVTDVYCTVPKGISPNGDGLNDFLVLTNFNVQKISIFNRDGKEVYSHGLGYTNQWMGQDSSGNSLPSGTYFYNIATPFENFTGWIQLTREVK